MFIIYLMYNDIYPLANYAEIKVLLLKPGMPSPGWRLAGWHSFRFLLKRGKARKLLGRIKKQRDLFDTKTVESKFYCKRLSITSSCRFHLSYRPFIPYSNNYENQERVEVAEIVDLIDPDIGKKRLPCKRKHG